MRKVYVLRYVERYGEPGSSLVGSAVLACYATQGIASVAMRTRALEWCNRNPTFETLSESETTVTYMSGSTWVRFSVCEFGT
jgi:hypothetical protein